MRTRSGSLVSSGLLAALAVTLTALAVVAQANAARGAGGVSPVIVKPVIARPETVPVRPVAGKAVTVRFNVYRSDTGLKLTSGSMLCDPRVGDNVIRHAEHFQNGTATLRFTIPASARGKLLQVHLTIAVAGSSASRVAGFRIG